MDGHCDVVGHWSGDGSEGADFWFGVVTDLRARGMEDIFTASVDGLPGHQVSDTVHLSLPAKTAKRLWLT